MAYGQLGQSELALLWIAFDEQNSTIVLNDILITLNVSILSSDQTVSWI
jgi:hypothetical protein